jgi:hypothetical protein
MQPAAASHRAMNLFQIKLLRLIPSSLLNYCSAPAEP